MSKSDNNILFNIIFTRNVLLWSEWCKPALIYVKKFDAYALLLDYIMSLHEEPPLLQMRKTTILCATASAGHFVWYSFVHYARSGD